ENLHMHYKNILVPFDFEAQSREALKLASQLAAAFDSAVTIVHAFDPRGYQAPSGYVTYTTSASSELAEALQNQLNAVARSLVDACVGRVRSRLLEGEPATTILGLAREEGFDLIVMGTHGRTGVWQKLLGSMAQQVLSEAPCPVMTIRAGVLEEQEKKASSPVAEARSPQAVREPSSGPRSSVN
ncbi:MAG: universal stress protein, partial [Polyangiaceae bacterium]